MQDDNERRAGHERVLFEALVAVDGDAKAGGYECEAMDVSQTGMHLRTAYLPEIGQELTLRFDAGTGEVAVSGQVVWREEQARGGEFGLSFTTLDDPSLFALRELCGVADPEEPAATDASAPQATVRGSRVRLHIEGLGSPMRARVKDAEGSAVMVGSNLDFLRVGRELELEDIEHGKKRAAFIDRVEVEIDPETKVPQLVVTLKYDQKGAVPRFGGGAEATKPDGRDAARDHHDERADQDDEQGAEGPGALTAFRGKASEVAASIGPAMSSFGLRAKAAMASTFAAIKSRGAAPDDDEELRVTAPAPDGVLSASGRKVVRVAEGDAGDDDDDGEMGEALLADAEKRQKRKILGVAAAAVTALVIFVLTMSGGKKKSETDIDAAAAASSVSTELAAVSPAAGGLPASAALARPGMLASGADAVMAPVPLFGAVPLSTTEAAAPAPLAGTIPPAVGLPVAPAPAAEGTALAPAKEEKAKGDATFGKGTVKNAKTVRLKMDAPIDGIKGAVAGKTLTISVPGRHNVEAASVLAKTDKRISSSKAVATSDGVDVSLTFKDAVPPFLAKTDGKTLAIELGEKAGKADADEDDEATPGKKRSKKHAAAKKAGDKHGKDKKKTKKKKH